MKNNKKLYYLFGGLLLIAIVGLGVFTGSGYLFKGALTLRPNIPIPTIAPPVATKPPAPKYSNEGASSTFNPAPINQDKVFASNVSQQGGASVKIVSSGDATNEVWFVPIDAKPPFTTGPTITTAVGDATSILAPAKAGTYKLYVKDAAGHYSLISKATLTVDNTAPTVTIQSPADGQTIIAKNVTVYAYANDNVKVTKVEFRSGLGYTLLGSETKPDKETMAYKHTFDLTNQPDGATIILSVWAYDAVADAGNQDHIGKKTIFIKVDNKAPDLTITPLPPRIDPSDFNGKNELLKLDITASASAIAGINKMEFYLDENSPFYESVNGDIKNEFLDCSKVPSNELTAICKLVIEHAGGKNLNAPGDKLPQYQLLFNPLIPPDANLYNVKHTITIRAYDNNNQYAERYIKFHVASDRLGDFLYMVYIVIDP